MKKPYAIIIMDGYGINPSSVGNAIVADGSKYVNELKNNYPFAQLGASGMSVGLPDGQMGNSEVGHLNIGAGRIVYQDLTKITKDIETANSSRMKNSFAQCTPQRRTARNFTFTGLFPRVVFTATPNIFTLWLRWQRTKAWITFTSTHSPMAVT
jgi:bisphosphoglycerate-independent phosphoglycerate mutase (AlkP superfamily)